MGLRPPLEPAEGVEGCDIAVVWESRITMTDREPLTSKPVCVHGRATFERCEQCEAGSIAGEHRGFLTSKEKLTGAKREMADEHPEFALFCVTYGDQAGIEFLEELADLQWDRDRKSERIYISDIHQHNACNHTISGILNHDGKEFCFIVESGDRNGTVIRHFGPEPLKFDPSPPPVFDMVPIDPNLKEKRPALYGVYLAWKREQWFKKLLQDYAYDRHFQPGLKIESHYREKARAKGLKIVQVHE